MKIVQWTLAVLGAIALALVVGGIFAPSTFLVSRSTVINAPPKKIYDLVVEPRRIFRLLRGNANPGSVLGKAVLAQIFRRIVGRAGAERREKQLGRRHPFIESAVFNRLVARDGVVAGLEEIAPANCPLEMLVGERHVEHQAGNLYADMVMTAVGEGGEPEKRCHRWVLSWAKLALPRAAIAALRTASTTLT